MPRIANNSDAILTDLQGRLARLVATAKQEGRDEALSQVRSLVSGGAATPTGKRGRKPVAAKTARKKSKKPRKNPWADLTPAQRLKRINAIRKGRGLPLKRKL